MGSGGRSLRNYESVKNEGVELRWIMLASANRISKADCCPDISCVLKQSNKCSYLILTENVFIKGKNAKITSKSV